jgi:two-component system NtrC family sensor kinase
MRLTRKFLLAFTVAIVAVLGLDALARLSREMSFFEWDMRRDASFTGSVIAGAVSNAWKRAGETEARDLIRQADLSSDHIRVRWVWLDDADVAARLSESDRRALSDGKTVGKRVEATNDGGGALYTYARASTPTSRAGAVELKELFRDELSYLHLTRRELLIEAAALLAASGFAASLLGYVFIGNPMRFLVAKARRVGTGDLTSPLLLPQHDELGELATEINAMCERLAAARTEIHDEALARAAAEEQLRHADRLTTVGKLASGIAHELGTPLNVIAGRAQLIAETESSDASVRADARIIGDQASRMARIIRQLLDFARRGRASRSEADLTLIAGHCVAIVGAMAGKSGVTLALKADDPVRSFVDDSQMQQALTNLVVNAIQATPAGGSVRVEVGEESAAPPADQRGAPQKCAFLRVKDTGSGMDDDTLSRAFEPFFTTKGVGEGTGLGLSVTYGIVKDHGGWIDVRTAKGRGTEFTIRLPRAEAEHLA